MAGVVAGVVLAGVVAGATFADSASLLFTSGVMSYFSSANNRTPVLESNTKL